MPKRHCFKYTVIILALLPLSIIHQQKGQCLSQQGTKAKVNYD